MHFSLRLTTPALPWWMFGCSLNAYRATCMLYLQLHVIRPEGTWSPHAIVSFFPAHCSDATSTHVLSGL
jgi:hypothetical protein